MVIGLGIFALIILLAIGLVARLGGTPLFAMLAASFGGWADVSRNGDELRR